MKSGQTIMSYKVRVENPVIPGFNPDPNIIRVGDDYYVLVSTFEWMPGIRVYHSNDLVNWEHITDILTEQVQLKGNPENCSIWAPQISYCEDKFYVVYTNVRSTRVPFKDCHNYVITAPSIFGPWSEPIYLNSSGFDPSIFHDTNGKKWLLNVLWDYRMKTRNKSCGIVLQELCPETMQLIGEVYKIFDGTSLAKTEAPLIYKKEDYYYLLTAEGGTEKNHSVTVCRAKSIEGPYEVDPDGEVLTARDKTDSFLQCTGHGSLVEGVDNKWYMMYLCTRPIEKKYEILGREAAIQEVTWTEDGWLRMANLTTNSERYTNVITSKETKQMLTTDFTDDFSGQLKSEWNGRRRLPNKSWCNITKEKKLHIKSGESLQSAFDQSLLAIRQKDFIFKVTTKFEFCPKTFNQMTGLTIYLDEKNYLYAYLTKDEELGNVLRIMRSDNGNFELEKIKIPYSQDEVELKLECNYLDGQFFFFSKQEWKKLGEKQNLRNLSGGFTGAYIGISVQDLDAFSGNLAEFSYFSYEKME